jgi:hypothetical protein
VEFLQKPFSIVTNMSTDVAVLRFFPGISESLIGGVLQPPLRGCVLMTYGQVRLWWTASMSYGWRRPKSSFSSS